MGLVTVTLSSVGNTRSIDLDYLKGDFTGVTVTGSSSGTFAYTVQITLDDVVNTPAASVSWVNDPGATALTSNSSGVFLYQQPLAGIRLVSTAFTGAVLTMKVSQGSL
jgi:hypothetical protein